MVDRDGVPTVVLDPRRSLPGRGAWLHPDLDCWELATRRSALTRALRTEARVDHDGISSALQALCMVRTTEQAIEHDPAAEPGGGNTTSPSPSAAARETGSGSER